MDYIDAEGFRANVGIVLTNGHGEVLLGGRVGNGGWQFPQGGIQVDETPEKAMFRELQEEIGLTPGDVEVLGSTNDWLRYRLPDKYVRRDKKPLCVGQKQQWFMLRLTSSDQMLQLDTSETPEFNRWRWVDYWRPVKEVIFFKRRVYIQALSELGPFAFPEGTPVAPRWWPEKWQAPSDD